MRITQKDREIYRFIERYHFSTVKQISRVFYSDINYGNELARKRLKALMEHGYIRECKSVNCSQYIYYVDDKYKKQTEHSIIIMDFLTMLCAMKSIDVLDFVREQQLQGGAIRSDALITITYNGIIQYMILEVQTSRNDYKKNLDKYLSKSVSEELMAICGGCFPLIILIDDISHNLDMYSKYYDIVQLDTKLTDFPFIFNKG